MKKLVAAFDGLKFSESTKEYALYLSRQLNAHLVGVFLEDETYHSYGFTEVTEHAYSFEEHINTLNKKDKESREEAVRRFESSCRQAGVNYSVHHDRNLAFDELLQESVFADLLILCGGENFSRLQEPAPSHFIRNLIPEVQCPVWIVPKKFRPVEKLVLLYDGSPSSVYSLKMFSYLFPVMKNLPIDVVTVKSGSEDSHLPGNRLMKEFMQRHYPKACFTVLKGSPQEQITSYLTLQKEPVLVVMGAFKRGRVGRLFQGSLSEHLMALVKAPFFLAAK